MGYIEDLYFMFFTGEFCFLIPLFWIESVKEMKDFTEEIPVVDYGEENSAADERKYLIILHREGKKLGMAADRIDGIRRIKEDAIILLEEPVINKKNTYLTGAARIIEGGEKSKEFLAFVIEPDILYGKFARLEKDCV